MTFIPPRCPVRDCRYHRRPQPAFYWRHGSYTARCRTGPVPRFRCRGCRRTFSSQTFRHDYRDRRPDCNELLFVFLASGVGLRQSGRWLKLTISSVQRKMRKLARTCRGLHRNLCRELPRGRTYLLDEEETFEAASIRPLTMPLVIERKTWFVVAAAVGPIRRLARAGTRRRRLQERDEQLRGRRRDRSRACVRLVLRRLAQLAGDAPLVLRTDEKPSYRSIARRIFGARLQHETTSGSRPRTTSNPLFAINTTMAMTRDNCGRLRRRSWLVSQRGRCLRRHLHIFVAYRNYVRQRFNRDRDPRVSSATRLGLLPRALTVGETLRWRQDWGASSLHPLSPCGSSAVDRVFERIA